MQVLHTLTRAMHLSHLGFHAILARRHGEIKAPSSRRIWYHRFYMMFVFENINQGLDEGEMVGGDDVSLHFMPAPLYYYLCGCYTRIPGIWNLPVTNQWSSISRLASCPKQLEANPWRSTQSKPPINNVRPKSIQISLSRQTSAHSPSFVILYVLETALCLRSLVQGRKRERKRS